MPTDNDKTPAELPDSPSGDNLTGDVVAAGIARNLPDYHEDLKWFWGYSTAPERNYSQSESARRLGIDPATFSKIFRGKYVNAAGQVLAPPAIMLSRIRVLRDQEREAVMKRGAGRVSTPTKCEIWSVCQKAWNDGQIAFIFGESHIGKTESVVWFRDENNHGATLYVDLQGVAGTQDIYRAFARALKISPDTPINKLMPRVLAAIDRTNLVIIDEFHHITYAYQKSGAVRMINALKSIKDRTGCAMVIVSTNVAREEFEKGVEQKLLKQLWRRGVIKLQLPDALRVGDVRAFAEAYKLDFPAAPSGADTWKALRAREPSFDGLDVCERIAYDYGVKHLISVFQDGNKIATKRGRQLTWADVIKAQAVYDNLSARKEV